MADVNANIGVNIDTSEALAQLKALQRQISQFHTSIAKSSESAALAQRDLQKNFLNGVNAIGAFSAELRTVKTTAESFTDSLEKNKFSMREYFRFAGGSTKTFGKLFKSEFDTIGKVAEDRVKRLQTQYIKLGRDTSGAMKAIAIMPNQLDMSNFSTQSQIAAQKQAIFNQLVKQGSTNLLNFGKNTQWAGRQLMVGFTLPLIALGTAATRTFMEMEAATIKFRKVYGDLFTPKEETDAALASITALGQSFTQYGVAVSQTVGLAAEAAAAGFSGLDLQRQTEQATRLSILGQVESQKALETTISLQNAFKMSSEDLAESINFLNAVENQTVVSLDDITTAIPKVAPIIQQLGGDVKDLAFFMAAMKEGGINASEGANALKSGLAALINPTEKASAMLAGYGINIKNIIEGNKGDLKTTVVEFAQALDTLDPLTRARAIEQLFGKFQFARLSTLFDNVTNGAGQAGRVLDLAGTSIEDLAALSESELGISADSAMNKFKKSVEDLKLALVPVGQTFLQAVTPIIEFVGGILEKFNGLSSGVKKAIVVLTVAIGAIGPVALMTFGLLANGLANIVKGLMVLRNGYLRLTGQSQILGEQTEYLTMEQIDATAASHSLDQSHARLVQTFTAEAAAITQLIAVYQQATAAGAKFAAINPGMMRAPGGAPTKRAKGKPVVVGGTGNKDTELALLTPGETVIPAEMSKKYGALINGMIAGNIPGYKKGLSVAGVAAPSGTQFGHITTKMETTVGAFLQSLQNMSADMQQQHSSTIHYLQQLANLGLETKKLMTYSGLGTWQGEALNEALGEGKRQVPKADILADMESQGIARWEPALAIGEAKLSDVAEELQAYENSLRQGIEDFTNLSGDATMSGKELEALEKSLRDTLPSTSELKRALDLAADTITEFRVSLNQSDLAEVERNFPGAVAPKVPGEKSSSGVFIDGVSGKKRKIRAKGDNLKRREVAGFGSYAAIAAEEAREVTDATILATARAAGTQSPSRRTIPIGEDIARGLQVGMANQQDEVAASGQALGAAAVSGTQSGGVRQRRLGTSPGGTVGEGGTITSGNIGTSPIIAQAIAKETQAREDSSEKNKKFTDQTNASMSRLNSKLMGTTFAFGSITGALSMFGADLGGLSPLLFKVNAGLFALASTLQVFSNAKFLTLFLGGFGKLSKALGKTKIGEKIAKTKAAEGVGKSAAKTATRVAGGTAARTGLIAAAGGITAATGGTALIVIAALAALAASVYLINKAYKKQAYEIERFGKAAFASTAELEKLGDVLNVSFTKTGFEAPSVFGKTKEDQETAAKFEDEINNTKELLDRVETLRKATGGQAAAILSSFGIQLIAQDMSPKEVQLLIETLAKMSGKGSALINARINLDSVKFKEDLEKGTSVFKDAFKLAIDELNKSKVPSDFAKNIELVGGVASAAFNAVSAEVNKGTISLDKAQKAFDNINIEIKKVGKTRELGVLKKTLANVVPEAQQVTKYITSSADALALLKAGAVGVELDPFIAQMREARGVTDELRNALDTVFGGKLKVLDLLRQVNEAKARLDEMEANKINEPVSAALTEEEKLKKRLEALKRMQTKLKISAILEVAKPAQTDFKENVEQIITDINSTLSAVDVDLQINPDSIKSIFDIEKELKRIDMDTADAINPEYRAAQFQIEDLNGSIEKYNRQNDVASRQLSVLEEKYQKQADALQEVADLQDYLASKQKRQISLADALTQGDIAAAAIAAEEMKADAAQFRLEQEKKSLENNPELLALREQIKLNDDEIYKINEQIYAIQQESLNPVEEILKKLEREKILLGDMKGDYDAIVAYKTESLRISKMSNQEIEQESELLQAQLELLETNASDVSEITGQYTQAQIDAQTKLLAELQAALADAELALSKEMPEEAGPMGWWRRQWERFKTLLLEDIPAFFGKIPEMISTAAGNIWSGLKTFGGWLLDGAEAAWNWIRSIPGRVVELASTLWNGLKTFPSWLDGQIKDIVIWLSSIPGKVDEFAGKLWNNLKTFPGWLADTAEAAWTWIKNIPGKVKELASTLWEGLKTFPGWLADTASAAWTWITNLPGEVKKLAENIWKDIKSFPSWLAEQMPFTTEMITQIVSTVKEIAGKVWDGLKTFGEWLQTKWEESKSWFTTTAVQFIREKALALWDGAKSFGEWLQTKWEESKSWFTTTAVPFIRENAGKLWNNIKTLGEWLTGQWPDMKTWFTTTLPEKLKTLPKTIWDSLPDFTKFLADLWISFKEWLTVDLPKKIADAIKGINIFQALIDQFDAIDWKFPSRPSWLGGGNDDKPTTPTPTKTKLPDSDGDGTPDKDDSTPTGGQGPYGPSVEVVTPTTKTPTPTPTPTKTSTPTPTPTKTSTPTPTKTSTPTPIKTPTPTPTPTKINLPDSDGDGTPDKDDKTPYGPAVTVVTPTTKTPTKSSNGGGGGGGFHGPQVLSSGGMVKPKYFSVGGAARGTDTVPAMLTPGEFVMSRYAVSNYGVDKMKAINSGTYEGEKVYNYNLSVNVKSDANPNDIARVVMEQIRQVDSQRIRGQRI
jgi:TP901 family phage tail tape measure protein